MPKGRQNCLPPHHSVSCGFKMTLRVACLLVVLLVVVEAVAAQLQNCGGCQGASGNGPFPACKLTSVGTCERRVRYKTRCGFLNLRRCTRYRTETYTCLKTTDNCCAPYVPSRGQCYKPVWSAWSEWGRCIARPGRCGEPLFRGTQSRTRTCNAPPHCSGSSRETRACNAIPGRGGGALRPCRPGEDIP